MKKLIITLFCAAMALFPAAAQDAPLRLAVAGITHGHIAEVTRRLDRGDFEIVGVYEADERYRNATSLSEHLPAEVFYDDLCRMLDETKPEAVICYGSIKDHFAAVEACAPRGIHVMVEKPLATKASDAYKMKKLAEKYGIMVLTNYETSWYASNHLAYDMVQEGKIGEIYRIQVYDGHRGPVEIKCHPMFLEWLTDPEGNGGGAVNDFGCYGANLATWLLGGEKPVSVSAVLKQHKPDIYPKVDDDATILVEYPSVTVQIMASWCWPYNRKDMYIYGREGYIYQENHNKMEVMLEGENAPQDIVAPKLKYPYNDSFYYLKAAVRGEIEVLPTDLAALENNITVVEILNAAVKSAKTGKKVKF